MNATGESLAVPREQTVQESQALGRIRARRHRFTSNIAGPIFFVADLLCILFSVPFVLVGYRMVFGDRSILPVHIFALCGAAGTYLLIRTSRHAYHRTLVNLFDAEADTLIDAVASVLIASALVWQFGMIANLSRGMAILYLMVFCTMLLISRPVVRAVIRQLAARGAIEQRIAFYGADPDSLAIIRKVLEGTNLPHLRFVGVADDRPKVKRVEGLKLIGGLDELLALARSGELDQVLFCVPNLPRERLHDIMEQLSNVSVDVAVIPAEAIQLAPDYRVQLLGQLPVLTVWQRPFRDMNALVKRAEDLLIAGTAVVLLSPVLLLTALAVRLSSPGPIFFIQPRIGFNNELIRVLKFRTMYADQTDLLAERTTTADDPRITPVGRTLRKLSLDELPQLFNVIRGDMSLVGPRPEMPFIVEQYDTWQHLRHLVEPGITGLWQISQRSNVPLALPEATLLDLDYIRMASPITDGVLLARTFSAVISANGAF